MNPLDEHRKNYITACFAVAVIYAFTLGGMQLPVLFRITDGIVYGSMICPAGLASWNLFRFAIPANSSARYRLAFLSASALLASLSVVGAETFVLYLFFPDSSGFFTQTIPARLFVTLLLFVILRLCFLSYRGKGEKAGEAAPGEAMLPSVTQAPPVDRITVRNGSKIKIIPVDEIIYIKADGDYIAIHTPDGNWLKEQTMKYTEEQLPATCFVRVHRSCIVNIHCISRIERYGEKRLIALRNNEKIKISAARYQLLKQLLGV